MTPFGSPAFDHACITSPATFTSTSLPQYTSFFTQTNDNSLDRHRRSLRSSHVNKVALGSADTDMCLFLLRSAVPAPWLPDLLLYTFNWPLFPVFEGPCSNRFT